jgi:NADPH-dependent 2,4-dienoyl-CoA reductase/sulfur reductase-like enzyme
MPTYAIVGTGPAGISAAQAIRSQDSRASILLIGEEPFGYYSRPGLAYYLTGEIPEKGLFPYSPKEFQQLGLRFIQARVTAIHPAEHCIVNQSGQRLSYDRLLLATGAKARQMNIPGGDLEGVVTLDNLGDARRILKLKRRTRCAVVVGGGITALELVEGLASRGIKVHYFLRGDRYWSNVLDETESRIVENRLKADGVQLHYHTELARIQGNRGRVSAVVNQNGESLECRLVAIAIGIRPRTGLAAAAGLKVDRGILVDEYLQTSAADIFAAGDVAQVRDPRSGLWVLDSLWGPAREQGHHAGLNMAGVAAPYIKAVPFNVTRLAGLTTTIIGTVGHGQDADLLGIARGDSETWRQLPDAIAAQSDFDVNRLRMMVGRRHLLGAILMGDQTLSQPLYHLISQNADITPIRDRLLDGRLKLGDLMAAFWMDWSRSNAAS